MDADVLLTPGAPRDSDRRAELMLGALVCLVVALLLGMFVFVLYQAWPSFAHNGLGWFGSGGNVDQEVQAMFNSWTSLGRISLLVRMGRPARRSRWTCRAASTRARMVGLDSPRRSSVSFS